MTKKIIRTSTVVIVALTLLITLDIALNYSSFMESYYNGFYEMQTTPQTISAWFGDKWYYIVKFFNYIF